MLLSLLALPEARADGCKFAFDGRRVPEREQRAFVEWAEGTETLYVAALSDPTTDATVWVVPVRASATAISAEPVEAFPVVTDYVTLKRRAELRLREAIAFAGLLDSGGFLCPVFMGGCGGEPPGTKSAVETARVEKLGMVVTVVSAKSRAELERYFDDQGVNRSAADLSSLTPYIGQVDYAFVCGWVAKRSEPSRAAGLKVVFPSPTIWFPLRPTRAYTDPVETVVYVRGFVRPASGCVLPQLRCEYIYGHTESRGVGQVFARDDSRYPPIDLYSHDTKQLTRVTVATDPQKWDRDLELVPGKTLAGSVAVAVTGRMGGLALLWSGILGAAVGLIITLLILPKAERYRIDWLCGAMTGAAIALTIWASAVVFFAWRGQRFGDNPQQMKSYVFLPALAVVHYLIAVAVCNALLAWINAA
jgi:hypothetical protein